MLKLLPILMTQRYHVFAMHFVGTSAFEVVNNAVRVLSFFSRFRNVYEGPRRFARKADSAPIGGETNCSQDK